MLNITVKNSVKASYTESELSDILEFIENDKNFEVLEGIDSDFTITHIEEGDQYEDDDECDDDDQCDDDECEKEPLYTVHLVSKRTEELWFAYINKNDDDELELAYPIQSQFP